MLCASKCLNCAVKFSNNYKYCSLVMVFYASAIFHHFDLSLTSYLLTFAGLNCEIFLKIEENVEENTNKYRVSG
ncbi:hypothetical protein PPE03_22620 [Pseudoalteromonas peptidolytica]|nr:hypothetical protein PPE03_22620 [Pseudoalteromonas peptidolytica]